jgi:farnesyl diphosphate synthase
MNSFKSQKKIVDQILEINIKQVESKQFRECLNYSIFGGKRLRPIIIMEMCAKLDVSQQCRDKLILLVEYLHCASLILDDLPSMDNDNIRRGIPTFHTKYGVRSAYIIANYMINKSLVSLMNIVNNTTNLYETHLLTKIASMVFMNNNFTSVGQMVDLCGYKNIENVKYRQIIDLILSNKLILNIANSILNDDMNLMEKVILLNLKTYPLFYLSFQLPLLLSKNESIKMSTDDIQYMSFIFSLCFQIADDFEDVDKDSTSFILLLGKDKAKELYNFCVNDFNKHIKYLKIPMFTYVFNMLNKKIH